MSNIVSRANVTGPFMFDEQVWGSPLTFGRDGTPWTHMAIQAGRRKGYHVGLHTPDQVMATKREDFRTVKTALEEFSIANLDEALRVLDGEHVHRSERFVGPVRWLRELSVAVAKVPTRIAFNPIWKAIGDAPEGYCHPRAAVTGSLLEDIQSGRSFETVVKLFNAKVNPLAYQRPKAAPAAQTVERAERAFNELGLGRSLERRFARLEDCDTIWTPHVWFPHRAAARRAAGHLFGNVPVRPSSATPIPPRFNLPAQTMTWVKFLQVLPSAERIEFKAPTGKGSFIGLTAAVHEDAPGLFKWDNKVAWYCYHDGSFSASWNVNSLAWVEVTAIVPLPTLWGDDPKPYLAEGAVLVLKDCVDTQGPSSAALFPECIRDDLHGYRSVIEAYSKQNRLVGRGQATACGYDVRKGTSAYPVPVRVLAGGRWSEYRIDRWD